MLQRRSPGRVDWLLAGLVFALAWAALAWAFPISPANGDVLRDRLLARDCAELGQCRTMGANTSVPGTAFAAVWVDLIATVQLLGGDAGAVRHLVLGMNALAVALLFFVARVHVRSAIALPAALLVLLALIGADMVSPFWNPSAVILPSMLCAASLLLYACEPNPAFLIAASFTAAMAFNLHPAAITLLPAVLLIGARRALLVLLVVTLTSLSLSWLAWLNQLRELQERHLLWPIVGGLAAIIGVGVWLDERFRRLSVEWRALWTGIVLVAPFLLGALGMVVVLHRPPSPRYLPTILGPTAVLLLMVPGRLLSPRVSAVLSIGLALWTALIIPGVRQIEVRRFTLQDAQTVAQSLKSRGWDYPSLLFQVQGVLCHELTGSMGLSLPISETLPSDRGRQLRMELPLPGVKRRATGTQIALEQGKTAVVEEIGSWLRPWDAQVCNGDHCERASVVREQSFTDRWNPEVQSLQGSPPFVARWKMPLVPNEDRTHTFQLLDLAPAGCRWQVTRVEGMTTNTALPSEQVELSTTGQVGRIILEKPIDPARCPVSVHDGAQPPCVFETRPGEAPFMPGATPG